MEDQGLRHRVPDGVAGVERRVRVLEDHLHLPPAASQLDTGQRGDVGAVDDDRAGGGLDDADHQAGQRGLARPALSDQPEGGAGRDDQGHAVDGVHPSGHPLQDPRPGGEPLGQVMDGEGRRPHRDLVDPVHGHRPGVPGRTGPGQLELVLTEAPGPPLRRAGRVVVLPPGGAQLDHGGAAGPYGVAAAVTEATGGRKVLRTGHHAGDDRQGRADRGRLGHRRQQCLGVGMAGADEQAVCTGLLHLLAGVHHHHLVGDLGDDPEVVGHEDHGHGLLHRQGVEEVEDLGLGGDVERGGRFVGDQ